MVVVVAAVFVAAVAAFLVAPNRIKWNENEPY